MHQMSVAGLTVDVVQKDIKNLHLGVYPPEGRVRIAVPLQMGDEAVRAAVLLKLGWIKRQQKRFQAQERQSARVYASRESHYFFGRRYLLNLVESEDKSCFIVCNKSSIDMHLPPGTDVSKMEQVFLNWYRRELKARIPPLIEKWEAIIGVSLSEWRVRKMKTRWGSCNIEARRIWLNLELAKKPEECLEYIIVHEMVHLLERHHNDNFRELMDTFMPKWRFYRDELNQAPLSNEDWSY